MASLPQSKRSFDVAEADYSSPESISFAGLLCIQDQKLNSPSTHNHQIREQDQDFAFSQTRQDPTAADLSKYTPADLLISNGKLVPQPLVFQPKQRPKHNQPRRKGSSPATLTASKRSGDKTGAREVSDKQKQKQKRNLVKEKNTTSRSGFGWKLFKSFFSPCQECKAAKPAVMSQSVPAESLKFY